jgi:hypothetical protein
LILVIERNLLTHPCPIAYILDVDLTVMDDPDERVDTVSPRYTIAWKDKHGSKERSKDNKHLRVISHSPKSTDSGMVAPELPDGDLEMFSLLDGEATEDLREVQGR